MSTHAGQLLTNALDGAEAGGIDEGHGAHVQHHLAEAAPPCLQHRLTDAPGRHDVKRTGEPHDELRPVHRLVDHQRGTVCTRCRRHGTEAGDAARQEDASASQGNVSHGAAVVVCEDGVAWDAAAVTMPPAVVATIARRLCVGSAPNGRKHEGAGSGRVASHVAG